MPLHDFANWKFADDPINDVIWRDSPLCQHNLANNSPLTLPGSVGGQQAMLPTCLPWVTDLVGAKSDNKNAVMVVGSAYAPFVREVSAGVRTMPFHEYRDAVGWPAFQERFLDDVVQNHRSYYGKIAQMFTRCPPYADREFYWNRLILTDWCRASFVKRDSGPREGPRTDKGGDPICGGEAVGIFFAYVAQNCGWHYSRLCEFKGKIVVLGDLAHKCLNFVCLSRNWCVTYHDSENNDEVARPNRVAAFWANNGAMSRKGRIIINSHRPPVEFTVVSHPGARTWRESRDVYPKPENRHSFWLWVDAQV